MKDKTNTFGGKEENKMSYCRFTDGDVYMYEHVAGGIYCQLCGLKEIQNCEVWFCNCRDALNHLKEHLKAGHKVPQRALNLLEEQIKGNYRCESCIRSDK
jgi:hypothetical protein